MLVAKDGISREIDEKNLQVYKDKGYVPVEKVSVEETVIDDDDVGKPLKKMTIAELEGFAVKNNIDISEAKNKAEILEIILANAPGEELKEE